MSASKAESRKQKKINAKPTPGSTPTQKQTQHTPQNKQQAQKQQKPQNKSTDNRQATPTSANSSDIYANVLQFFDDLAPSPKKAPLVTVVTPVAPKNLFPKPSVESKNAKTGVTKQPTIASSPSSSSSSSLTPTTKLTGWDWFRSIGSPKCVLGPMVGQSELAFRMLCRRYGVSLCYSPMFVATKFVESKTYRDEVWSTCPEDRPLVVQFCGNDPAVLIEAAKLVQHQCDAIDINLGCPQEVAKRQNYGAFLMDHLPLVKKIVTALASALSIPVVCKIRRFSDPAKTLMYGKMLEEAGCSLVAIHPRTREQKEEVLADWNAARALKAELKIPVVVNGDLWHAEDVQACLSCAPMDGFMSAQGLLHNPALFEKVDWSTQCVDGALVPNAPFLRRRRQFGPTTSFHLAVNFADPRGSSTTSSSSFSSSNNIAKSSFFSTAEDVYRQFRLATEYCDLVEQYPVGHPSVFRRHLFFLLFDCFQANFDLYEALFAVSTPSEARPLLEMLQYRAETGKLHAKPADRKLTTRRDGSLAPPPWPVGGGQLSEHEAHDKQASGKQANKPVALLPLMPPPPQPHTGKKNRTKPFLKKSTAHPTQQRKTNKKQRL